MTKKNTYPNPHPAESSGVSSDIVSEEYKFLLKLIALDIEEFKEEILKLAGERDANSYGAKHTE